MRIVHYAARAVTAAAAFWTAGHLVAFALR
jgi:hypothetical protein